LRLPNRGGRSLSISRAICATSWAILGGSGYVATGSRFSARNVPRSELLLKTAAARQEVESALGALDPDVLDADYPLPLGGRIISTGCS